LKEQLQQQREATLKTIRGISNRELKV